MGVVQLAFEEIGTWVLRTWEEGKRMLHSDRKSCSEGNTPAVGCPEIPTPKTEQEDLKVKTRLVCTQRP